MKIQLITIHAQTPLHAGTGQAVGAIDLPIARERPTGIPILPGSSIKGALRARSADDSFATLIFGPKTDKASDHAGAVQFSDAHLLLLPVRSLGGTFAWVTSPYLLARFARDAREAGLKVSEPPALARIEDCLVFGQQLVLELDGRRRVVLEDLSFNCGTSHSDATYAGDLAQQVGLESRAVAARLCVVHDDVMSFLLENATEVMARIRLDEEKKTVAQGALWYEEALPAESVLVGLAVAQNVKRGDNQVAATTLLTKLAEGSRGLVQFGGKATVGRGLCRVAFAGGES